eukprot:1665191-Rhodomonas_salina.1
MRDAEGSEAASRACGKEGGEMGEERGEATRRKRRRKRSAGENRVKSEGRRGWGVTEFAGESHRALHPDPSSCTPAPPHCPLRPPLNTPTLLRKCTTEAATEFAAVLVAGGCGAQRRGGVHPAPYPWQQADLCPHKTPKDPHGT